MDQVKLVAHANQLDVNYQQHQLEYLEPPQPHDAVQAPSFSDPEKHPVNIDNIEKGAALTPHQDAIQPDPSNTPGSARNSICSPPAPDAPSPIQDTSAPIKDRGWAAWKFVLASAATEFMIWGASYGYGSFQDYHQHDPRSPFHQSSLTATSSIGTTLLAGQHFIPLLTFGLYSIFPSLIKKFTYTCVVASSLSLLVASFANSVALLIVFQGLLLGVFGGNLFTTIILWLPDWWDQRRGFATALIFAGSAIGGILWPIIFTQLLERIGFRWTLRTWALIQLVVSGSAVMCIIPGHKLQPITKPLRWRAIIPGFPRSLLSPLTLLNCVALLTQTTAWYSVSLNISNYASSMGFSSSTSTGILSVFNASAAITYFILGYLVDRFPYPLIMATSTTLNLVFTVLVFGFAGNSLTKIIVYVVFFGISGGGFSSFLTPVSRDIPDQTRSHEFSLRFLYLVAVRGLAAMLGPIIAVQFYPDHLGSTSTYGSYGFTPFIAFISATLALSTLASLCIFAYKRYVLPKQQRQKASSEPITPPPERMTV
ncbi:related to monocarboxylate permease [Ustilago trichophora]|uniref:Related to monocarboxylate permease n=1 Tax=Ustilago trichophora TaxID=86804 RepID=A0A5C3E9Z6_9BASI|nr:related to monocarboxylate permease [Ustilago trichophora]